MYMCDSQSVSDTIQEPSVNKHLHTPHENEPFVQTNTKNNVREEHTTSMAPVPIARDDNPRQTTPIDNMHSMSNLDDNDTLIGQNDGDKETVHEVSSQTEEGKQQDAPECTPTLSKKMKLDKPATRPPECRRTRTRGIVPS
jgi:hypothetical protein